MQTFGRVIPGADNREISNPSGGRFELLGDYLRRRKLGHIEGQEAPKGRAPMYLHTSGVSSLSALGAQEQETIGLLL